MGFNRRDLDDDDFDFDNNDDDFDFEDSASSDFDFGDDEPADIGLDDDAGGFGFEDEDMPDIDEDSGDGGGVSRTFIIIAALMILLFVGGLVAVLLISQQNSGPTEFDLTVTARVAMNSTTEAQLAGTQTQAAIIDATGTAFALIPTDTPTPTETPTPSPTPTEDIPPTQEVDETQQAAFALQTQAALDQTATAEALLSSPTPQVVAQSDVALTATALAEILAPQTPIGQGGGDVPTQEVFPTSGVIPTALPDTGFFEDLAGGSANIGMIFLIGLGLIGLILVSRRVRLANSR